MGSTFEVHPSGRVVGEGARSLALHLVLSTPADDADIRQGLPRE